MEYPFPSDPARAPIPPPGGRRSHRLRTAGVALAIGGGAVLGALVGVPAVSNAQGTTSTTAPSATRDPAAGKPAGPHAVDGRAEELLTGDLKARVEAATLAKYPGATVERAETDVDGATYEAHITTADGEHLTVLFDADLNITGTEQGRGGGGGCGGGGGGRRGAPTDDAPTDDTTGG